MSILFRAAGMLGVAMSIIGLLFCVAGTLGVWLIKRRVDAATSAVFIAADDACGFMTTRLEQAEERIASAHLQVNDLSARADRWRAGHATRTWWWRRWGGRGR